MTGLLALAVAVVLATVLLAVPVDVRLRLSHDGGWAVGATLGWMFGILSREVGDGRRAGVEAGSLERGDDTGRPGNREATEPDAVQDRAGKQGTADGKSGRTGKQRRKGSAGRGTARALAILRTPGFPARVLLFGRHLLRAVSPQALDLEARMGLDDPADTGVLWGLLAPLPHAVPLPRSARVRLEPDFAGGSLAVKLNARLRIVPLEVVVRTVQLLLSPRAWRAVWAAARA